MTDNTNHDAQLSLFKARPLFRCSSSKLTTWVQCPRRYRYAYLDRPTPARGPARAHLSLGASVHTALANWWNEPLDDRTPERGEQLLRAGWVHDGFRDRDQSQEYLDDACTHLYRYLDRVNPLNEPTGVERFVSVPTSTLIVDGRIDRLDDRHGHLVVVDYKVGRYVPNDYDAKSSLALAIYALAVGRMLRRECFQVELHHIPSGVVAAAYHDHESLQRKVAEAESIAEEIIVAIDTLESGGDPDGLFPTEVSALCGSCDFRSICADGQQVPEVEPWGALASLT